MDTSLIEKMVDAAENSYVLKLEFSHLFRALMEWNRAMHDTTAEDMRLRGNMSWEDIADTLNKRSEHTKAIEKARAALGTALTMVISYSNSGTGRLDQKNYDDLDLLIFSYTVEDMMLELRRCPPLHVDHLETLRALRDERDSERKETV